MARLRLTLVESHRVHQSVWTPESKQATLFGQKVTVNMTNQHVLYNNFTVSRYGTQQGEQFTLLIPLPKITLMRIADTLIQLLRHRALCASSTTARRASRPPPATRSTCTSQTGRSAGGCKKKLAHSAYQLPPALLSVTSTRMTLCGQAAMNRFRVSLRRVHYNAKWSGADDRQALDAACAQANALELVALTPLAQYLADLFDTPQELPYVTQAFLHSWVFVPKLS